MTLNCVSTDVQQIRNWLGLPAGSWPPDHYTLLGLPAGETDIGRIEQHVHDRLVRIRCYQLSNAALATEAMTLLAKAFDCLTNAECKRVYDATHFPHLPKPAPASPRTPTTIDLDTAESTPVPCTRPAPTSWKERLLRWQSETEAPAVRIKPVDAEPPLDLGPLPDPAVQTMVGFGTPLPLEQPPPPVNQSPTTSIPVAAPAPGSLPPPALSESGKQKIISISAAAMQQLGTRRELFERVLWTRKFGRAWDRAGKYLNKPKRQLTKAHEDAELIKLLGAIDELVQETPGLLGQPGQPGYRILAQARLEPVAERFKALDDDQREALARDWTAGRSLLEEYRRVLRDQIKGHRKLSALQRGRRAIDSGLAEYGGLVVFAIGVIGLLVLLFVYLT